MPNDLHVSEHLSGTDGCCEGGLGVASIFAQFAETVLRNLAIHLILDYVDVGTVTRTATSKIIERGHRFPYSCFRLPIAHIQGILALTDIS